MKLVREIAKNQVAARHSDVMAVAAYLHHFYTGVEAIFERISIVFDGRQPISANYQRELLSSMTLEIPDVRPRIITKDLWKVLDELREFRDMFRHAYGGELSWSKVEVLASKIDSLKSSLSYQIENFIKSVEDMNK
ncbi:ribonuclease toxin HepT-like protein [Paradesulfitobacterium ferrireducens]|uniref:ribonuclease toxin HepT-like protein n=1 Tax=Paradesulfitobacterium ferrireducens TaxID=2816476 RepID=UPI001A8FF79E|nr:hypothetical protein [Paradesulfitobacterium ferrireducens]